MTDFPQGATKGVGTSTLMWLRNLPFRDRADLTEWLLKQDPNEPINPRTDRERKAYVDGWINCFNMAVDNGLPAVYEEIKMMAQFEWPERFDEEGNLKPSES